MCWALGTKEINSGFSRLLSDSAAPEAIFTDFSQPGKRNCIFQLISRAHKAPQPPGPSTGASAPGRPGRGFHRSFPAWRRGCPLSPKCTACLFGPFEPSSRFVRHAWENPAQPGRGPAALKGPAPQAETWTQPSPVKVLGCLQAPPRCWGQGAKASRAAAHAAPAEHHPLTSQGWGPGRGGPLCLSLGWGLGCHPCGTGQVPSTVSPGRPHPARHSPSSLRRGAPTPVGERWYRPLEAPRKQGGLTLARLPSASLVFRREGCTSGVLARTPSSGLSLPLRSGVLIVHSQTTRGPEEAQGAPP